MKSLKFKIVFMKRIKDILKKVIITWEKIYQELF